MKNLLSLSLVAAIAMPLFAQEAVETADVVTTPQREEHKRENNVWPAFFSVCEFPANPDVVGLRLTIPFSTKQENVTGVDLGLWKFRQYGFCLSRHIEKTTDYPRSISRRMSFSLMDARLSNSFFPRASAICSFAYPFSAMYSRTATIVRPLVFTA